MKIIPIESIGKYALNELATSIYRNSNYRKKINRLTRWEILNIFRERSFEYVCLKLLTLELEKYPTLSLAIEDNSHFYRQLLRELLIYPSNRQRILVIQSDSFSHGRLLSFLNNFKERIEYDIPKCLIESFEKIDYQQIEWQREDSKYLRDCMLEGTASHYNGAAGYLLNFRRAIDNNVKIIDLLNGEKIEIQSIAHFYEWIVEKFNFTVSRMVENAYQERILISEK